MSRLRSRYWGPFRQEWYSICSIHYYHNTECSMCTSGTWCNCLEIKFNQWLEKNHYGIWYWLHNKTPLRRIWIKRMQQWFPNMR